MKFVNEYKLIYSRNTEDGLKVYASKDKIPTDADLEIAVTGKYKLVYEKDGVLMGSLEKIPTTKDEVITSLNGILFEVEAAATTAEDEPAEEPAEVIDEEPEMTEEPESEEPEEDETEAE